MGMPITVEVVDNIDDTEFEAIFTYFKAVDERYRKLIMDCQRINGVQR